MRALPAVPVLLVLGSAPAAAQFDWRADLRSDQVVVSEGNFTYTETGVITIALPGYEEGTLQYRIRSEAPATGVISRDNFIGITAQTAAVLLVTLFAESYDVAALDLFDALHFEQTDALIGNADLQLNLYMTGEGLQMEVIGADGQPIRHTQTWEQVYGVASR